MIVYNELVALTAGAALIGVALFLKSLLQQQKIDSEGWAAFFGVTGILLLATGLHTTLTWPFGGGGFEYANVAFGQPAAAFGALLSVAAIFLWRHRSLSGEEGQQVAFSALKPVSIFVGALGLGMAVLALSFVRYQLGAAPPTEPISGNFGHLPVLEALFLGFLWGVVALGCILFALGLWTDRPALVRWAGRAWLVGGILFLLFGALNYYTHLGMYYNEAHGTSIKW